MKIEKYRKLRNTGSKEKAEKKLIKWLHTWIRLRDLKITTENNLIGRCISCGKQWDVRAYSDNSILNPYPQWIAGHYFLSDRNLSVKFDERNINLQCYWCNRPMHGNLALYEENLKKKIGNFEFDELVRAKNKIKHYSIIDFEEMAEYYKEKAKKRAKELRVKI